MYLCDSQAILDEFKDNISYSSYIGCSIKNGIIKAIYSTHYVEYVYMLVN